MVSGCVSASVFYYQIELQHISCLVCVKTIKYFCVMSFILQMLLLAYFVLSVRIGFSSDNENLEIKCLENISISAKS